MRKAIALLIVSAMVVAVAAVAGCGSDTGKAKSYMKQGDVAFAKLQGQYNNISVKTSTLVSNYAAGKNTEPTGVKASVKTIKALLVKAKAGGAAARSQYNKILTLKDVADYKAYAKLQIQVIDKLAQANASINQILDMIQASATSGQPPDFQKIAAIDEQLTTLGGQIETLVNQANNLKKTKKL